MKLVTIVVVLPVAIVAAAFAIANRAAVTVSLDPLPYMLELPLYYVLLGGVLLGLLIAGPAFWLSAFRAKLTAKRRQAAIERLETEVTRLREEQARREAAAKAVRAAEQSETLQLTARSGAA
ncbi:lipopolysaccharide assembly protein LapA domain-containing protein [Oceanibacterium hippocampi]|uniref:Lipopolysaccharide assembly protein A domain-containing protein n=1 Tax=Oceanibacterium hippocampi TaxID=745714 RepID=A0A1Y5RQZ2_9PROT|nr:lipopolysaccharide assembly protein LapA domain-containing protein [Oceanibacterium hippocampi]SLN22408.1 hypothetical protein OCH7691_00592 [Oceanibacterium hippocampi]